MSFVAEHQANRRVLELLDVETEGLVRDNDDGPGDGTAAGNCPLTKLAGEFLLGRLAVDSERRDRVGTQPLDQLVCPVPHQTRGTGDDGLLDGGLAGIGRLLKEGPQQGDALQGLSETHLVGHDATVCLFVNHARDTPVHKLDTLDLMGPEHLGQAGVDDDRDARMFALDLFPDSENLGKTLVHQRRVNLQSCVSLLCVRFGLGCLLRPVVDGRVVKHDGKLARGIVQGLGNKHSALPQPQRWRRAVRVVRGMVLVHEGNGKGLAEHLVLVLGLEDGKLVGISVG